MSIFAPRTPYQGRSSDAALRSECLSAAPFRAIPPCRRHRTFAVRSKSKDDAPESLSVTAQEALTLLKPNPILNKPGVVYLVGAGPGDPGLLTLAAFHLLQTCDVIMYDRLVSHEILNLAHSNARMVYVGKQVGYHTRTQSEIHELMSLFAEAGSSVIRLKGGDPYVFGRGGEEMEYLKAKGITVKCIPGVTAASGISAELGIPLTHRGMATSVRFLLGHSREHGEEELAQSMIQAIDPYATLVIYMGLMTLPRTIEWLIENGQDPKTPAVAVERGTTDKQKTVFSEMTSLGEAVQKSELKSPTLIIIGEVVALSPGWKKYVDSGVSLQTGRIDAYLPRAEDLLLPERYPFHVQTEMQ